MNQQWTKFVDHVNKAVENDMEPPKVRGKALVLLSGGMDSTTALYWARNCFSEIEAISFGSASKVKSAQCKLNDCAKA